MEYVTDDGIVLHIWRDGEWVENDHPQPYWRAVLSVNGEQMTADTRFGSWMFVPEQGPRRPVLPDLAADLQDEVHAEERRRGLAQTDTPPPKERL